MAGLMGLIGTGLGLVGGIEGLIAGDAAANKARIAELNAIRDFKASANQEYVDYATQGNQGLLKLSGGLNDVLAQQGRGLGAAMAGAGVYNSSATAGALTKQAGMNASTLGGYSTDVANTLARMKQQSDQEAAQMSYGMAQNDMNFARQQQNQGAAGLTGFLNNMSQMNFGNTGARGATMGTGGSILTPMDNTNNNAAFGGTGIQLPNQYYDHRF